MAAHPDVEVELNVSNRNIDLVEDGYDLAIRLGEPRNSRLVARKREDASLGVFASPAYLKHRCEPTSLDHLREHDLIQFVLLSTGRPMRWSLSGSGGDSIEFSFKSRHRVHEAGQAGHLVEVLRAHAGQSRPFYVLYPHNRHLSARVRAFVDHLAKTLGPP